MPATKPLRSGTCAITLLAMMTSARLPSATRRSASSMPKNSRRVGTPTASAASAWSGAGSMPSTGTPRSTKLLQQVAVVAGDLDDEAVGPSPCALDQPLGVRARSARAGRRRTTRSRGSCRRRAARAAPPRGSGRGCTSGRTPTSSGNRNSGSSRSASATRASASGVSPSDRNGRDRRLAARAAGGGLRHARPPPRSVRARGAVGCPAQVGLRALPSSSRPWMWAMRE